MDLAGLIKISGKFPGCLVVSCLIGLTLWAIDMSLLKRFTLFQKSLFLNKA